MKEIESKLENSNVLTQEMYIWLKIILFNLILTFENVYNQTEKSEIGKFQHFHKDFYK